LLILLKEMNHVPFADKPAKSAYMWRDIERRAAMYNISAKMPAPYPVADSELANRVAVVGMNEG
jgi:2-hydroxychromene-2-carboxylate isomerase